MWTFKFRILDTKLSNKCQIINTQIRLHMHIVMEKYKGMIRTYIFTMSYDMSYISCSIILKLNILRLIIIVPNNVTWVRRFNRCIFSHAFQHNTCTYLQVVLSKAVARQLYSMKIALFNYGAGLITKANFKSNCNFS